MRDPVYTYCREVLPPSTVDKAASLSFTRAGASNLVLARGNVLELYEVELVMREAGGDDGEVPGDDYLYSNSNAEEQPQLHLVNRWSLHGRIMDMQAVRCSKGGKGADKLILSFAEAKMSLVGFDASTQNIVTESLHYYEHENLMENVFNGNQTCDLRSDPEGRCVAMRIYGEQLAILPLVASNEPTSLDGAKPYAASFVVDLRVSDVDVRNIRDFVFLGGYLEPTLVVLHEQEPSWPGLLEVVHDTSSLTVVSLDLSRQSVSVLSSASSLPSDCQTLVPIPDPIGGVLILATSSILHVVNGAISCMCALNQLTLHGVGMQMSGYIDTALEDLQITLCPRNMTCILLSSNTLAMWTQHGAVYLLRLVGDGRLVKRIEIKHVAGADTKYGAKTPIADIWDDFSLIPSCATELLGIADDDNDFSTDMSLFFVGGRSGRSLLLGVERNDIVAASAFGEKLEDDSMMDIDSDLYGDNTTSSAIPAQLRPDNTDDVKSKSDSIHDSNATSDMWANEYRITVYDELLGTGPVTSMEMGTAPTTNLMSTNKEDLELVTCAGNEWRGCLRVQQRHIQPEIIASFDLPGAPVRKVWTVRCLKEYNIGGVMQAAETSSLADLNDTFMILSRDESTAVFAAGDELREIERTGFFTAGPTVEAGEIFSNTRIVQVHARGLRVLNASGREMQSIVFAGDQEAVSAEVSDPHVLLRTNDGKFILYEAARDSGELRETIVPLLLRRSHISCVSFFRDMRRVLASNKDWVERNKDIIDEQALNESSKSALDKDFDSLYVDTSEAKRHKRSRTHGRAKRRLKRKRVGDAFDELYEDDDDDDHDANSDDFDESDSEQKIGLAALEIGISRLEREEESAQQVRGEDPLYLVALLASGDLSIFRLPHFDLVWTTPRFDHLLETLSSVLPSSGMTDMLSSAKINNGSNGSTSGGGRSSSDDDDDDSGEEDANPEESRKRNTSSGSVNAFDNNDNGIATTTASTALGHSLPKHADFADNENTVIGSRSKQPISTQTHHSKRIDQLQLVQLGGDSIANLHLLVLTTAGEVAVYRAFEFCPKEYISNYVSRESNGSSTSAKANPMSTDDASLALRFVRVQHDILAYDPNYERKVQKVQVKQMGAFAAWEALTKSKHVEKAQEEKLALERARAKQQREDPAAIADWDDDSDNDQQSDIDSGNSKVNSESVAKYDDNGKMANLNSTSEYNSSFGDKHDKQADGYTGNSDSLEMMASFSKQPAIDDLYADEISDIDFVQQPIPADNAVAVSATMDASGAPDNKKQGAQANGDSTRLPDDRIEYASLAWTRKLVVLDNVGGYPAVFITGLKPILVIVGTKRYARVHPLRVPVKLPQTLLPESAPKDFDAVANGLLTPYRPVVGLARFHSSACQHGFVALTQAGTLVIAMLPTSVRAARGGIEYDSPWPVRCIPVGTAHPGISTLGGVAFHSASGSYVAASTTMEPFYIKEPDPEVASKRVRGEASEEGGSDSNQGKSTADSVASQSQQLIPEHERPNLQTTSVPPLVPRFYVDLLSPVTWETVDSYEFEANEHIVEMRTLELESSQTMSGSKPFLCVATGFVLGEDVASRGRIYIFDIIDVVPLPGRPQTNRRLKLLFKEEMRGTVSALGELRGNLVVSVGSKLFVRAFNNNEMLLSIAFLDCQSWIKSLKGFRNYLLIGDLVNSIWFAGFQEDGPTKIQVLGRDYYNRLPVEHADLLVQGQQLQLLTADSFGNMHFFIYAPRDAHSFSGQKLLRRGEYNLRSRVTGIKRLVASSTTYAAAFDTASSGQINGNSNQQVCIVSTEAGAVYAVTMIPEKVFKRLHRINTQLVHGIPPPAGLNPREYRAVPLYQRQYQAPRRTVLDADLLVPFYAHGPISRQREAAQRDGTSADRVLRDIVDVEHRFAFF
ncbi:mRNA cleavage and polyadenylation factor subunit [Coemansia spiralis]|uniref:mRNA cleavage and polyadenylation factor subunit n=2 Tax=Coemansia TaxID=4863 RepID=A0A9W8G2Z6_9FUNG|nr:mRNA cleavage and polyadenylation factor subunit [Coemansia umbellata]KAJ2622128.1 mRNA cleavage and polyadenylation factor subunit [Coemansia sp. RSA 1358]KAJ2671188.1 mRNA cleavage and polyadenylation factor subunit [Coemansia spiralis]